MDDSLDTRQRRGARSSGQRQSNGQSGRMTGPEAVQAARAHLEELTGRPCESASGLTRTQDGWAVVLECVELERVPRSTDIMASYRVEVDGDGELLGYERIARYYRNQAGGD